jgi:hypothetical protein
MNRMHVRGGALALLLSLAACGDSATDVVGNLTEAEAEALAEVVAGTVVSTWETGGASATAARSPALATFNQQVSLDAPCEFGGTVAINGEIDIVTNDETEELESLEYTVTQAHAGCVAESQDGIRFTLDGAPNVTANLVVLAEGDAVAMNGSYSGAVDWATDGKAGTCTLSVEFSLDLNVVAETGSATMAGTVCGMSFSNSVSVS